jgi:threonylcarbamoyladenosine tRNA methylthiotransferase MtaB
MYYERSYALHTLGCKLNFSESSAVGRLLQDAGYRHVPFEEQAAYYVINTCSVTEEADKKCRYLVRNILRRSPEAKVIIMGCYAQLKPKEIASIPGVSMVLGASDKFKLAEHLEALASADKPLVFAGEIKDVGFYAPSYSYGERTRSFLKVQDGCDYFCTFCTIPLARGRSRSASIEKTVQVAKEVAATGVKEVVLTGVNIGDYGKTEDGRRRTDEDFYALIQQLDLIEGIERWRISSIEPNLLTEEIVRFVSQSKHFMPHFHVPLQSGSDRVLKAMRRKYESSLYRQRVEMIKSIMPHACIGVDVIVGFPGETEEEFLETYEFLRDLDISYLHVFTYSERDDTRAAELGDAVPVDVRRKRNEMLRILSEKKKRAFYDQFVGQSRSVLFEAEHEENSMYGFTDNYIRIQAPYDEQLVSNICEVHIHHINANCIAVGESRHIHTQYIQPRT